MIKDLKEKIKNNVPTIGSWIQIGNSDIIKVMIESGFEWLVLDMEHGNISFADLGNYLNVFNGSDCIPFVRIPPDAKGKDIKKVLDLGFRGLIISTVSSQEDVIEIIKAAYYPPIGQRGIGFCKANDYGIKFDEYVNSINDDLIIIVQIENKESVDNIDEIFANENIHGFMIGPYDLSGSLGHVGDFTNQLYKDTLAIIKESAKTHNIPQGIHIVKLDITSVRESIQNGNTLIAYGTDAMFLNEKCKSDLKEIMEAE